MTYEIQTCFTTFITGKYRAVFLAAYVKNKIVFFSSKQSLNYNHIYM